MSQYPRVLVVEDDPITLLTFTLDLQAEGFEVLGALSAREGQATLLTSGQQVTAVVIDLGAGAAGAIADLACAAGRLKPAPALIYTSDRPDVRPPSDASTAEVLIKPCPPKALANRVRKAISG